MNEQDFRFKNVVKGEDYEDYYFYVTGDSKKELTKQHMEQGMIEVNTVVYASKEDNVMIQQVFPFNYKYVESEDSEIKKILQTQISHLNVS